MAEAPKRFHDPPTGQTPGKKPQKRDRRSGTTGKFLKSLFQSESDTGLEKDVEKHDQKVYKILLLIYIVSEHCVLPANNPRDLCNMYIFTPGHLFFEWG